MSKTLKMADGDLFFDASTGKGSVIVGPEKLYQDIADVLMTVLIPDVASRSSTDLIRNYGNELSSTNAPPLYSGVLGKPIIAKKVDEAVTRLMNFQASDPNITLDEKIKSVKAIDVVQLSTTDFFYRLDVIVDGVDRSVLSTTKLISLNHQELNAFDPLKRNGSG